MKAKHPAHPTTQHHQAINYPVTSHLAIIVSAIILATVLLVASAGCNTKDTNINKDTATNKGPAYTQKEADEASKADKSDKQNNEALTAATSTEIKTEAKKAGLRNGYFVVPKSELGTTIKKYEFKSEGTTARFIAAKMPDGTIRVAFDGCQVCGGAKGYRQEGNSVVCNNCGKKFRISELGTRNQNYGCWPAYLEYEEFDEFNNSDGKTDMTGEIRIKEESLREKAFLFR